LDIIKSKARDYAPEDVAMIDVFYTAAETRTSPEAVLWVYLRKHMTSLRRWIRTNTLDSETPTSRLQDACNYLAMLDFIRTHREPLLRAVWSKCDDVTSGDPELREHMKEWIAKYAAQHGIVWDANAPSA
jgi:hypothetical protein